MKNSDQHFLASSHIHHSLPPHKMHSISLPLELLIKIVTFALDDDQEKYSLGEIGEIPEWKTPSQNTLDRVLRRKSRSDTPILTAHITASGVKAKAGETPRSVTNDADGASETTTCTYTLMTALRLYVVIVS
jgi:mannitol-1-phosphate/altronate dehydrogenase